MNFSSESNKEAKYTPSDFMRSRRPELFSDSIECNGKYVDKSVLEFQLDTLTSRQQEFPFEHLCRRLAEKEICPNLIPQTGPMGGGDSKVDTETHPISDDIAERWYLGEQLAAKERWGFAISAKKDWRSKVRKDVKSIIGTDRGYTLIYFMTNQAVSSKKRSEVEDKLCNEYGVPVKILDRSWLMEKIVNNERWDIVSQTLDIEMKDSSSKQTGPNDAARLIELKELDDFIDDPNRYIYAKYQLVEDCLQTALLARGLGHSRSEVDGRFARAERLARKEGNNQQLFKILYHKAWTAHWWFDDYDELNRLYEIAAPLVFESEWAWDLEYVSNLCTIGRSYCLINKDQHGVKKWEERISVLKEKLFKVSSIASKPSNALWARTQLAFIDLHDAHLEPEKFTNVAKILTGILKESSGLLDYPFHVVVAIIEEAIMPFENVGVFDELYETAIELQTTRSSQAKQGNFRLNLGIQKLKFKKSYEAIKQFGKAQSLLAQNEHIDAFISSSLGLASSYESVGLLWAARANLIVAVSRIMYEFLKDGFISKSSITTFRRLVWVELQLGRVPCVLGWIYMMNIVVGASKIEIEDIGNELECIDVVLGILVLKTDFNHLNELCGVASVFEQMGVFMSRAAILYSLGQYEIICSEFDEQQSDIDHFFELWFAQPANKDLPPKAEWFLDKYTYVNTIILGCRIQIRAKNKQNSIVLAESLVAFLESFMATTLEYQGVLSSVSRLDIDIEVSDLKDLMIKLDIVESECCERKMLITHRDVVAEDIVNDDTFQDFLFQVLATFIPLLQAPFTVDILENIFKNERAQDRAYWAATVPIALCDLISDTPSYDIDGWLDTAPKKHFDLIREQHWNHSAPNCSNDQFNSHDTQSEEDINNEKKVVTSSLRHKDIFVASVINIDLWNAAKWKGVGLLVFPSPTIIPTLAIIYKNIIAGEKIFRSWNSMCKGKSADEIIDITIVKGVDKFNPYYYSVIFSANFDKYIDGKGSKNIVNVSRCLTMEPQTSSTLDQFLYLYERTGVFNVMPLDFSSYGADAISQDENIIIKKKELRIVDAWKIGPDDPAVVALKDVVNPVVPDGVIDPPFSKVKKA